MQPTIPIWAFAAIRSEAAGRRPTRGILSFPDGLAEAVPPVRASVLSEIFMAFPCRMTAMWNVCSVGQSLSRSAAGVALTRRLLSPYHAQL
jgi:hypothetical protein